MAKAGIKPGDYAGLESYYMARLTSIISKIGNSYIVWQEPLDNGVKVRITCTHIIESSAHYAYCTQNVSFWTET